MNTTVAIVLPAWAVYLLSAVVLLSAIESILKIITYFLARKVARSALSLKDPS